MARYGIDEGNAQHPRPIIYSDAVADLRDRSGGAQPFVIVNGASQYAAGDVPAWEQAGAAVAMYWYGDPSASPEEQATAVLRFGRPVWCDLEVLPITAAWINSFCATVSRGGQPAGWYDDISVSEELRSQISFPLWLAAPSLTATDPLPVPCVMQQLAAGPIAGISAPADIDVWRGDKASFRAFFRIPNPAPEDDMPLYYVTAEGDSTAPHGEKVDAGTHWITDGMTYRPVGPGAEDFWQGKLGAPEPVAANDIASNRDA